MPTRRLSTPLTVTYKGGQIPDTMSEATGDVEIVVEGRLDGRGTFAATDLLAKSPSRLADAEPTERDYQASNQLMAALGQICLVGPFGLARYAVVTSLSECV